MELYFATSNKHKLSEAQEILKIAGVEIRQYQFDHTEIRSDSVEEIAKEAVQAAYEKCKKPVFVEDTGLFIKELNDFPGTYSGWVLKKVGSEGIIKLMKDINDRHAYFKTCIAYHDGRTIHTFQGICSGEISNDSRGESGFGYDPIFIPEGYKQTFAENVTLKNKLSHRYKTLLEFSTFLKLSRI